MYHGRRPCLGGTCVWLRHNVTSLYQIAGTCKWYRVHGLSGRRVAAASIMPDVVRADTNVTTMIIAERCADFIQAGQ